MRHGVLALGAAIFPILAAMSPALHFRSADRCKLIFTEDVDVYALNGFPYYCQGPCPAGACEVVGSPSLPAGAL